MYLADIIPFLQDELNGLDWSQRRLEEVLSEIYETGKGYLDPAVLVNGESWLEHTSQYGFADALAVQEKKYSFLAPVPASRKVDLVDDFLDTVQKSDVNASQARAMMRMVETVNESPPAVTLVLQDLLQYDDDHVAPLRVGPAEELVKRPKKRNHARPNIEIPGQEVLASAVVPAVQSTRKRTQAAQRSRMDCVILNSSGKPQLLAALEVSQGARVVFCQEHHCVGTQFADLQHDAKKLGWALTGAPATRTARDGNSAGVAVAVKAGIPFGDIGGSFDLSPSASPGRLSGAWIQAGPDTGMLFLSIYLYHTEGATIRNKAILQRAFSAVAGYGSPMGNCG